MSAACGKPKASLAIPPDTRVQGRFVRIGTAEDVLLFVSGALA